MWARLMIS